MQALFTALSGPQGNQILQGRSGVVQPEENPIETGLVHALSCIKARPNFREIVSTTNEYGQTLAHLAILYDYSSLLHHLVDWGIDLALSDINGLTALHCAYMKGDLHGVRILRRGGAPEATKDKLGRIPSDLQPEGFGRGLDTDVEMNPPGNDIDKQVALGFSALALGEDKTSEHGQSESEDDAPDAKKPVSIAVDSFTDGKEGVGGSGRYQFAPGFKEPVIERFRRILPTVAARPSGLEREKSPRLAHQSMSHSRRKPSPTFLGMFSTRSSYNHLDDPLTVALVSSIPSDEMPAQRQQRLALEAEARHISDEIDERLRQERIERDRKKVVKVLLLGRLSQFPFQTTSCKLHPFTPGQPPACARPILTSCILSYNTRSEREWKIDYSPQLGTHLRPKRPPRRGPDMACNYPPQPAQSDEDRH